nr:helix-turn-helix domain-containing protein [Methylobacterium sp. L1A1]
MNYHLDLPQTGFVTPKRVQHYLSISNSTMYQWLADKYLPPLYKVGPRAVRFRAEDIREFETKLLARTAREG